MPRRHPCQTGGATATQQPEQDCLGLIIGVMGEHNHLCAGLHRECRERCAPSGSRPRLGGAGTEVKRSLQRAKTARLCRGFDLKCDGSARRVDAVVDVADNERSPVLLAAQMQQVEKC